jgi:hypothetical protein
LGGRNDVQVISGSASGASTTLRFRRLLVTGDSYDTPIKSSGTTDLVYAWRIGNPGEVINILASIMLMTDTTSVMLIPLPFVYCLRSSIMVVIITIMYKLIYLERMVYPIVILVARCAIASQYHTIPYSYFSWLPTLGLC